MREIVKNTMAEYFKGPAAVYHAEETAKLTRDLAQAVKVHLKGKLRIL